MPRRRSNRALSNDAAIRAAAVDVILTVGVDGIAYRDVARAAKLTHGALYARFEDVEELLVDLWSALLLERAVSLFDVISRAVTAPSKESVAVVMDRLRHPIPEDIVMIKVLWTSRRHVILHEEVESFIHDYLETSAAEMSGALHSRALTLFSFTILTMISSYQGTLEKDDLDCFEATILESLQFPTGDVQSVVFKEPVVRELADPTDDLRDRLAYHTYLAVGTSGYSRATISRISRRADCSPGAIYKIYPTKEDLVIGSVRTNMTAPWIRIATLATILEPNNLAQFLFSAASSKNSVRKNFTLEVAMASAYNHKLRKAVGSQLRDIESVVPLIEGLSDDEVAHLKCTIRFILFSIMGVSYLSTLTKATDHIDFNQFAEPVRQSILNNLVPSWPSIKRQLENISSSARPPSSEGEHE
jgi:AcrR family transcriptional regulator